MFLRILCTALFAMSVPAIAVADTLTWPGSPGCSGTLQACIDVAVDGDRIEIATDAPITESIALHARSLTLTAADGFRPEFVGVGIIANDSGGNEEDYTAVLVTPPANGALVLAGDGGFFYTPNAGFAGTDSFTYQVHDDETTSNVATVTITVSATASNGAPVAVADSYTTNEGQTLNVGAGNGVLDNDTDPDGDRLTAFLVSGTSSGTLTLQPNGGFNFAAAAGFVGTVTFTYEAGDGALRAARFTGELRCFFA